MPRRDAIDPVPVLTTVRLGARIVTRHFDAHLRPYDVTAVQLACLLVCVGAASGGLPVARIANVLAVDASTLSRLLTDLERRKLIVREARGRTRVTRVTRAGKNLVARARGAWQDAQDALAEALGGRGVKDLLETAGALSRAAAQATSARRKNRRAGTRR